MVAAMKATRVLTMLSLALITSSCGGRVARAAPGFAGDDSRVLTIEVRNDRQNNARMYLWIGTNRQRLGDVPSFTSETFRVPLMGLTDVYLEFDLTLGVNCVSDPISLGPGESILAVIPVDLSRMRADCRRE